MKTSRPAPTYADAVRVVAAHVRAAEGDSAVALAAVLSALLAYPEAHRAAWEAAQADTSHPRRIVRRAA